MTGHHSGPPDTGAKDDRKGAAIHFAAPFFSFAPLSTVLAVHPVCDFAPWCAALPCFVFA